MHQVFHTSLRRKARAQNRFKMYGSRKKIAEVMNILKQRICLFSRYFFLCKKKVVLF